VTIAVPPTVFEAARSGWTNPLGRLAGCCAALLLIFRSDVADLATIYWQSTTFGHCLFVLPIVGWLIWTRRTELAHLQPTAWAPGLLIVAVGAISWLLGAAAGVALARHLGLVLMLQGSVVALLGPAVAHGLLFPLAYLLFLVPFGDGIEAPLQSATVSMTMALLRLAGVPASVDGVLITIPNGYFEVAEACSGAKFVIAMTAFAALAAHVCFERWGRRIAFFVMAIAVAIVANGVRAFGTIYAAHLTSVQAATGFDHIVYGWVFFAGIMAVVVAIGWRWFDRDPDAPAFDPSAMRSRSASDPIVVVLAVLGIAAAVAVAGPALAGRRDTLPAQLTLPDVPGWHRVPLSTRAPWQPSYPTADHLLIGRYADTNGRQVDIAAAVYAGQWEGHEVASFGQGLLRENDIWVKVADEPPLAGGRVERITAPGPVTRVVASWYRLGGMTTASPRSLKIQTLKLKLLGGSQRATALHLSSEGQDVSAIATFLRDAGSVDRLADRIAAGR
jgi:exosortase A